ncbi:uncharacterized protein C8A04DRAFT_31294 [Dichotomopilus funicola]|uniref:ABM domain-containing protein n=1 Tax=Dichotomopilus funicola TaxID=1934379 RepID=A0AAN6UZ82_9PEZI|nr:hypothetical protein C8A04DRAFT_31294 [Dichotomopilus funicola]
MSNQEELQRQLREIQLQRQLEMRRHAIPRFGPAVDGVLWSRVPPEEDADKTPQGRILSILELPLKPGVDMHNDSGSNPSRKLWDAALRYISSIPGCCAVEWAQGLEDPPVTLLCMIQWDSTVAWRRFQHSLGFTPLIALLHSDVSNRCAKLDVSGTPRLADAEVGTTIVDVVSVTFPTGDGWSPDGRLAFEESWNALVALVTNGPDGPRHSFAVWLESNASTFFDPTPAESAASTKTATFTAFLAWDRTHYGSHRVDSLCDSLRASLLASYGDGPSLSRRAAQLISQVQPEDHDPRRQPAAPPNSLPDILEAGFPRRCSADLANLREHTAQELARSISDARARTRLFPAPQGFFISQGELYDGNMPVIPEWRSMRGPVHGYHLVDVVWMQLKGRDSAIQGRRIYNQLDNEISALPGFVKTFLAHDVENKAKVAVLTVWEDQDARATALPEYRRILDEFAGSSVHVAAPLTHQAFPMARDPGPGGLRLNQVNYLELTSFHVPTGAVERKLFEHAYGAFARMTEPSVVAGIPKACIVSDAGGWQPAEEAGGSDLQLFTGVLTWVSPAARHEWYEELFRLSRGSYELFGHRLDALKILAAGGVTTRFLELQI